VLVFVLVFLFVVGGLLWMTLRRPEHARRR
jgi:hypothetical protein